MPQTRACRRGFKSRRSHQMTNLFWTRSVFSFWVFPTRLRSGIMVVKGLDYRDSCGLVCTL